MSLQSEAGIQRGWRKGEYGSFFVLDSSRSNGNTYSVLKHSTRSKYRGYYIERVRYIVGQVKMQVIAKNLTRSELIAWVKLLKEGS